MVIFRFVSQRRPSTRTKIHQLSNKHKRPSSSLLGTAGSRRRSQVAFDGTRPTYPQQRPQPPQAAHGGAAATTAEKGGQLEELELNCEAKRFPKPTPAHTLCFG
jgi:hypothetical protein